LIFSGLVRLPDVAALMAKPGSQRRILIGDRPLALASKPVTTGHWAVTLTVSGGLSTVPSLTTSSAS
jgi:hypothetical protein